jgi:flagellar FliJ protein
MKKFNFRLQRVLDFRNVGKKEKELELARENARLQEAEQQLRALEEVYMQQAIGEGEMTMADLMMRGEYSEYLRDAIELQQVYVEQAIEAVEAARDAYIEKAIEAETLETLKKKRIEEHKEEVRHDERKELDKLVVSRFKHKKA